LIVGVRVTVLFVLLLLVVVVIVVELDGLEHAIDIDGFKVEHFVTPLLNGVVVRILTYSTLPVCG
jgi:hypothetical protein